MFCAVHVCTIVALREAGAARSSWFPSPPPAMESEGKGKKQQGSRDRGLHGRRGVQRACQGHQGVSELQVFASVGPLDFESRNRFLNFFIDRASAGKAARQFARPLRSPASAQVESSREQ